MILLDQVRGFALPHPTHSLDVGCGSGRLLELLSAFGPVRGVEIDATLARLASRTGHLVHEDLTDPKLQNCGPFHLITCLDVLEHVADDAAMVRRMVSLLHPNGYLVVTVPASRRLWDKHDEINRHFRRYDADSLRCVLTPHGRLLVFRPLFPELYLPKLFLRQFNRRVRHPLKQHGLPPHLINVALARICTNLDRLMRHLPVPFGTSLLAVLQRTGR